ncbi:MAG: ChbG/HpnK family deacetylase [Bryobacterales bacterium]
MKLLPYLLLFACAASAQSAEKIRLIVRGDDFGYTHASNEALEPAFERGVMTSASMLVPGPWFAETARIVKQHPKWSVGVHLTITSEWNTLRWPPVAAKADVPSLVAPDGFLWGFGYGPPKPANWPADGAPWATAPDSAQAEGISRADRTSARDGRQARLVDCHMGMACREELLPVTQKLAKEFCLGISSIGMFGEQRFSLKADTNTPAGMKAALLKELAALQPGLYLYVGHPTDTPELRAVDTNDDKRWADIRSSVLAAWTDPEVIAMMKKRNIELTPIRSLFDKTACAPLR